METSNDIFKRYVEIKFKDELAILTDMLDNLIISDSTLKCTISKVTSEIFKNMLKRIVCVDKTKNYDTYTVHPIIKRYMNMLNYQTNAYFKCISDNRLEYTLELQI